jgi:glycine hydroxymethyltransferase
VGAFGVASLDMREFGAAHVAQMAGNARELARAMHTQGIPVLGAERGFTRSHQILPDVGGSYCSPRGFAVKRTLEQARILADAVVRLGVQEATRLGMLEDAMVEIAGFVRRLLVDGEPCEQVGRQVADLLAGYRRYHFCVDSDAAAYESLTAAVR